MYWIMWEVGDGDDDNDNDDSNGDGDASRSVSRFASTFTRSTYSVKEDGLGGLDKRGSSNSFAGRTDGQIKQIQKEGTHDRFIHRDTKRDR
jgi:hypothetical protein